MRCDRRVKYAGDLAQNPRFPDDPASYELCNDANSQTLSRERQSCRWYESNTVELEENQ